MFTGRYGYGKQYECQVCKVELALENEAEQSQAGFRSVVNRLMRAENYDKAEEIFETYRHKWGDKI